MIKAISIQIKCLQYYAYARLVCHPFGYYFLINFGPVFALNIWICNQYGTSDPGLQLPFNFFLRILKQINGFLLFDLLSPVYRSLLLSIWPAFFVTINFILLQIFQQLPQPEKNNKSKVSRQVYQQKQQTLD